MSATLDIDPRILPYTTNNDPLPSKLKPVLAAHLDSLRNHTSTYDVGIRKTQQEISDREKRLGTMEKELVELRIQLMRQEEAKERHNKSLRTLESTTSVVRRVPPEIIARVITFMTEEHWTGVGHQYLCRACAVSKLWRSTALSTPSLWRHLNISLNPFAHTKHHDEASLLFTRTLDLWFSRAGEGAAVDLWISKGRWAERLLTRDVIDWLLASRFKFVSLKLYWIPLSFSEVLSLFSTGTPSLQQMRALSLPVPPVTSQIVTSIDIGCTLPALDDLALLATSEVDRIPAYLVHPTLSKLALTNVVFRPRELRTVLEGLPSLQYLELCYCSAGEEAAAPAGFVPLTHHSLRTLHLYDSLTFSDFVDGLSCPNLEQVQLDTDSTGKGITARHEYLEESHALSLGNFLHRSHPSNLTFCLSAQFPATFLNPIFLASRATIKGLHLGSSVSLPVDIGDDGTQLVIPSSVHSVKLPGWMSESENTPSWMQKLVRCFKDPPQQALVLTFGVHW